MKTRFYHPALKYQDDNYDFDKLGETGISLEAERIVCLTCNGNGSHFRKDLDENSMVSSIQDDCDEDSMEAYQNGAFDQVCTECNGRNVVDEVKWSTTPKWIEECVNEWETEIHHDALVRHAECGYPN